MRSCINVPQMTGYAKYFDNNKAMPFKVSEKKLLKKYIKIWEQIKSLVNKEFDSEPVYGGYDKYINTKIKSYGDKINTIFHGNNASFCY